MELIRYDAACRALAECKAVDEVKDWSDKAQALQAYAKQAKDPELERMAAEIRLRAKRRVGEISLELEKAQGARTDKHLPDYGKKLKSAALKAAGISKSEAHRCERLAKVPPSEFEAYIEKCHATNRVASSDELAKRVTKTVSRNARIKKITEKNQPLPDGQRYNIIYADPPWQYRNVVSEDRRLENHYPTMTLDAICALDVPSIAAPDCLLYLWATITELPGALQVMGAWGFEYRSHCVWVKPSIGIGFWYRSQHELLLLGVKGDMPTPIEAKRQPSVIHAPVGKHSEKPSIFREMIDDSYADLPRIELFSRAPAAGWSAWGNQSDVA